MEVDASLLQEALNYNFKDKNLLIQALTHPSFAYESKESVISDNQRLEFLGDSVLDMAVADYLYKEHLEVQEGELTRLRSLLVNNKGNLTKKAKELNLSKYLLLGKGEEKTKGRENATNLSGALEAIIGAIYLDGGFEEAYIFVKLKVL